MLPELGLFLTVDSECRLDALIMYIILLIDLAMCGTWMSACVITCGCVLSGFGFCLMDFF